MMHLTDHMQVMALLRLVAFTRMNHKHGDESGSLGRAIAQKTLGHTITIMKFETILISISWLAIQSGESLFGATLIWNNSASTGNWNSSDANWTSSIWNNSTPDDAVFENRSETFTLIEPITAGTITVSNGGEASGPHTLLFTGSSMSATGINFNGAGLGGSVDSIFAPNSNPAFNQILRLDSVDVTVAGNILFSRGTLEISGTSAVTVTGGI